MRWYIPALLLMLADPAIADGPDFVARTAAGKAFTGPLAKLSDDWAMEIGKEVRHKVASGDLLALRQKGGVLPGLPVGEHLILSNGDLLPFTSLRIDDEKVIFRHPDLGADELTLSQSSVLIIWRSGQDRGVGPEKLRRSLLAGQRKNDIVFLRNGDRVEGTLNKLTDEFAEFEINKKTTKTKLSQVSAIALSTDLADKPKLPEIAGRVVLTTTETSPGGRLTLVSPNLLKGELRAKTTFGAVLRVPLERVASLELLGGKGVALSSLKPAKYEYRPYLDEQFSYALDATVLGHDLRVGGASHERGVGTHATCVLSYELEGKYRRFTALVGLDDRDGKRGRVRVRVLADGKVIDLGQKEPLTHKSGPWRIDVPVEKAKTLALEVVGEDDNVQAVVNWVEAWLVK